MTVWTVIRKTNPVLVPLQLMGDLWQLLIKTILKQIVVWVWGKRFSLGNQIKLECNTAMPLTRVHWTLIVITLYFTVFTKIINIMLAKLDELLDAIS